MFANVFQKGEGGVEIFSPSGTDPFRNVAIPNESLLSKEYDRLVKGYVASMIKEHSQSKLCCPKQSKQVLGIFQPYLCFQLQFVKDKNFSLELVVADEGSNRKRIIISTAFKNVDTNQLHARIPLRKFDHDEESWITLIMDLRNLTTSMWKSFNFKSLESFSIFPCCKIRKIFTLPNISISSHGIVVPVGFDFPLGVRHFQQLIPHQNVEIATEAIIDCTKEVSVKKMNDKKKDVKVTPIRARKGLTETPVSSATKKSAKESSTSFKGNAPFENKALNEHLEHKPIGSETKLTEFTIAHEISSYEHHHIYSPRVLSYPMITVHDERQEPFSSSRIDDNGTQGKKTPHVFNEIISDDFDRNFHNEVEYSSTLHQEHQGLVPLLMQSDELTKDEKEMLIGKINHIIQELQYLMG